MSKTVEVSSLGGPDVLKFVSRDPGVPAAGEIRIRHTAIGVNFADIHYRRGTAPAHSMAKLPMPFTPGLEAAGVVENVGEGVTRFSVGDRVAYASSSMTIGAYSESRCFAADLAFRLPESVSDVAAAALMYRAITVHGIIRQCYVVKPGDVILLHAAAGGIGSILSRWANYLGATVIGTVSSAAKVASASAQGCEHVIVNDNEDFVKRSLQITDGRGVDVIFDGVGGDVFLRSFGALKRYGTMVSFGQAAGLIPPFNPIVLQHQGHYLTKFSGGTYNDDLREYHYRVTEVLTAISKGVFDLGRHTTYPFDRVRDAHADMESQRSTGSLVLLP